ERVRGGGWDLPTLQRVVDQFVIHYDAAGTSKNCFRTLQDFRGLSVHFMIDLDGTIYQTLDVKERAFHATTANTRSVGVEIANIGAFPVGASEDPLDQWYRRDDTGKRRLVLPISVRKGNLPPNLVVRPIRDEPVVGEVQGKQMR